MGNGQSQKKGNRSEKGSTEEARAPALVSPIPAGDQYDVFLSFRGSDIRKEFADHLYHSLVNQGTVPICVFRDENSLPIGKEFGSRILDAITRSKISIPIISENYASSKWCLRELIHIMNCNKSTSHIVLPIFYKVTPSDVRHLKGNFGEAFHSRLEHFDTKDVEEGQRALKEVSDLNGWESEKIANGHEGELIELVVETVVTELRKDFQLHVPKELVGLHGHLKETMRWIESPSSKARMIGIYGMGGIGKTTLAKCIYNQLSSKFAHASFLPDVREATKHHGIVYLLNQLISDILPSQSLVSRVDEGINIIKSRFKGKKVIILLDDIDHKDQLDALAGEHNWFTTGSMIIVTTRYEAVLDQSEFEVDYKYELNEMDEVHSLLLFNKHAFRMDHSPTNFEGISGDIISTMGGLPLAIKVIGSYLYKKTNLNVWKDVLKQLKEQPHNDVQKILKISYDALEEGQKEIFLDIACFFIGKDSKYAMYMWDDCGFYPSQGIEELKLRCLIKIGYNGKLKMHDQLRDLRRSISNGQSLKKRSRFWDKEEAFKVLMEKKGTRRIQAMCLGKIFEFRTYTHEQFKNLGSLRFLELGQAALSGDFNNLFSELRWLQWFCSDYNLSFVATNLHLPNLVVLQLSNDSNINSLTGDCRGWNSIMSAKRLKVLDFTRCSYLRCNPDLSAFTELELLILKNCERLEQVHPSIGKLKCLVSLDLRQCRNLEELPEEMGELKELRKLNLDGSGITNIPTSIGCLRKLENLSANLCSSLREIPNSIGNLSSLQHLTLEYCWSLREIPSSIGNLFSLQHLNLYGCRSLREIPSSIGNLFSLQHLDLHGCQSLRDIPSSIGDLQNLLSLDILDSEIKTFPSAIGRLKKLRSLYLGSRCNAEIPPEISDLSSLQHLCLTGCMKSSSLTELPSGLTHLTLTCDSPSLPQLSCLIHLEELLLSDCELLEYIPELPSELLRLIVRQCPKLILPEVAGLRYLVKLKIVNCSSIGRWGLSRLNRLKKLVVCSCDNLLEIQGHDDLESLEEIDIYGCTSVQRLILPKLSCLKKLRAASCKKLIEIQGLDRAEFLEELDIHECESMERLPDLTCFKTLKELNINGCRHLCGVESLERFLSCRRIFIMDCESLEKLPNLSKFECLESFTIINSRLVREIPGIGESRFLTDIYIGKCQSLEILPDLSRCKKLRKLVVAESEKLAQLRGFEQLDLTSLEIYGCSSLKLPELHTEPIKRTCYGYNKVFHYKHTILLQ